MKSPVCPDLRLSPVRLARLGHRVFIPATGVRIPYGTPSTPSFYTDYFLAWFGLPLIEGSVGAFSL